jgi:hypothetical protein
MKLRTGHHTKCKRLPASGRTTDRSCYLAANRFKRRRCCCCQLSLCRCEPKTEAGKWVWVMALDCPPSFQPIGVCQSQRDDRLQPRTQVRGTDRKHQKSRNATTGKSKGYLITVCRQHTNANFTKHLSGHFLQSHDSNSLRKTCSRWRSPDETSYRRVATENNVAYTQPRTGIRG